MGFSNSIYGTINIPLIEKDNPKATMDYGKEVVGNLPFYGDDEFPFLSREFFHCIEIEESKIHDFRSKFGGSYKWYTISCGYTLKEVGDDLHKLIEKWEFLLQKFDTIVDSNLHVELTPFYHTVHYRWKYENKELQRTGPPIYIDEIVPLKDRNAQNFG